MISSSFFIFFLIFSSSYAAIQDFCVADYTAPPSSAGYSCKNPSDVNVGDFCVADYTAPPSPAGYSCKNPSDVKVDDFVYSGLGVPGNSSNINKFILKTAFVAQFPGLNGLGISLARGDLEVGGVSPMHSHRGASEAILIAEGKVISGFIALDNKAYVKTLKKGDIMVLPQGLLHFQVNAGDTPALIFASFSSDNPGVQVLETALFQNDLHTELIAQTTLLDTTEIKKLKCLLGGTN
ncbi:auxin-binding protein ABP19a-like [Rosa sericea]